MAELPQIRDAISQLDSQLLQILAKRRALSIDVAKAKMNTGKAIRDQKREQLLLTSLINQGHALKLEAHFVTQLYHHIIEDSVLAQQAYLQRHTNAQTVQREVSVAFLGNKGSYSNIATQRYFSRYQHSVKEHGCASFQEIVDKVEQGYAEYGVLPIENTSSGSINEVYDVLQHTSLAIVGELSNTIDHGILAPVGRRLEQIKTLYAHPQPYQQCSQYLSGLGKVHFEFVDSSSKAMEIVANSERDDIGAIGSAAGGEMYGLRSLITNIANQQQNETRFIVVARHGIDVSTQVPARTTFIMSTNQQAGALVEALLVLREHKINMTKLESRPVQGKPWEEMFYVDVSANVRDEAMLSALSQLRQHTRYLKVLGCYPTERVEPTQVSLVSEMPSPQLTSENAALGKDSISQQQRPKTRIHVGMLEIGGDTFVSFAGGDVLPSSASLKTLSHSLKAKAINGILCTQLPRHLSEDLLTKQLDELKQYANSQQLPCIMSIEHHGALKLQTKYADMLFIRDTQMYDHDLLKACGQLNKPVILARHTQATLNQWLEAADLILSQGNQQVILCECEHASNALDLNLIAQACALSHLPLMIKPLVANNGDAQLALLCRAAKNLGANGILLETNDTNEHSLETLGSLIQSLT